MPYFPELSAYTYFGGDPRRAAFNVGWLRTGHPFPTAEPDPTFVDALVRCAIRPARLCMGIHPCDLCPAPLRIHVPIEAAGRRIQIGNGEIVVGTASRTFRAPTLVVHYVRDHAYRPPAEFIAAVLDRAPRVCVLPDAERASLDDLALAAQRALAVNVVGPVVAAMRDDGYRRAFDAVLQRRNDWVDVETEEDDDEDPVFKLLHSLDAVLDDELLRDTSASEPKRRAAATHWLADLIEQARELDGHR
jgi:hypothetical protein